MSKYSRSSYKLYSLNWHKPVSVFNAVYIPNSIKKTVTNKKTNITLWFASTFEKSVQQSNFLLKSLMWTHLKFRSFEVLPRIKYILIRNRNKHK